MKTQNDDRALYESKLAAMHVIVESALSLVEKGICMSNEQINTRLDAIESKLNADELPTLLTGKEVQAILGICRTTLYGLAHRGDLKQVSLGRGVRYSLEDVNRLKNGYAPIVKSGGKQDE